MKGHEFVIDAYIYSSCTSCRKTVAQLDESGVAFESRDFFKDRFTKDELQSLLDRAGLKPSDILSTRSKVYKARGLETQRLGEDELLTLMIEEPTLLRRPLVIKDGTSIIGHNTDKLNELISG